MLWLLLLPQVVLSGSIYSDHIEKYLDKSIEPCDDFFSHVCSSTYNESMKTVTATNQYLENAIKPFISKNSLELQELIKAKLRNFQVEVKLDDLLIWERTDAFNSLMKTAKFKQKEEMIAEMFEKMKNTVLSHFESAPWALKKPDSIANLTSVKLIRYVAQNSSFDKAAGEAKDFFNECTRSTVVLTQEQTLFCARRSIDLVDKSIADVWANFPAYLISELFYFGFNGMYNPNFNDLFITPAYYVYDFEEVPFMLGSLLRTMGHELSHVFFHGNEDLYPSNSDCFQEQMQETCMMYFEDKRHCDIYKIKDTFSEDASDWVAWRSVAMILKTSKYYSKKAMQQLFYATTINWCTKPFYDQLGHSSNIVRINGILRAMYDFGNAFECKKGSPMIQGKKCTPFTGEGSPEYRKKAMH